MATGERLSDVARQAAACRHVVDHFATSIAPAWAWVAKFLWMEWTAVSQRITGVTRRAGADRYVVPWCALSVCTALTCAYVNAPVISAYLVSSAVGSFCAFTTLAVSQWIAPISWKADAHWSVVPWEALRVGSTGIRATDIVGVDFRN